MMTSNLHISLSHSYSRTVQIIFCLTEFRIFLFTKSGSWMYWYRKCSYDSSFALCPGDVFKVLMVSSYVPTAALSPKSTFSQHLLPDLILIQIEFDSLQVSHSVRDILDLVFWKIYHIQMAKTRELCRHSPKLVSRKAQGFESWKLSKCSR